MEQHHLASQTTFQFLAKCFYVSHKFANKIKLKPHSSAKLNIWSMSVHLVGQMSRSKLLNMVSKWQFFILALFFCLDLSITLCFCQLCGINAKFSTAQLSWKRPRLTAEFQWLLSGLFTKIHHSGTQLLPLYKQLRLLKCSKSLCVK